MENQTNFAVNLKKKVWNPLLTTLLYTTLHCTTLYYTTTHYIAVHYFTLDLQGWLSEMESGPYNINYKADRCHSSDGVTL